jgi:dihydrolipoamide dehydrogenase
MIPKSFIVIGAGPGGMAATLEAAARGLSVTLVESQEIGGTCLNRGCIPSKFFLSRAKNAIHSPIQQLVDEKESMLATLRQRLIQSTKSASIRILKGEARFLSDKQVEVTAATGTQTLDADAVILATGSSPSVPAAFPQHPAILTSDTVFSIDYLPSHLVVLGGGYIGCELACAFQGLGSKVTLIEKEKSLLATQGEFQAAAPILQRSFEKRGMTVWTGTEIKSVVAADDRKLLLTCSNGETIEANALLLSLGRRPNLSPLGLEKTTVALREGRLSVNEFMQTSCPHIYAIGDLVSPLPLAHTAAKEAEVAVRHLLGESPEKVNYSQIPRVVYTSPEAAAVGLTETQAQGQGHKTRIDRYHFAASSKAMIEGETDGFWMILSDTQTRKILGALVVGPHATELIHLVALSLKAGLTTSDIAETVFAHPTLSEGFQEAMKRATQKSLPPLRGKARMGGPTSE